MKERDGSGLDARGRNGPAQAGTMGRDEMRKGRTGGSWTEQAEPDGTGLDLKKVRTTKRFGIRRDDTG